MKFIEAKNKDDLIRFYPVLKELRDHLSFEDFINIYNEAQKSDSYTLIAMEDESGLIAAVMGYRYLSDYVHGKHFYIDDLVITEKQRSKGLGAKLLDHAESIAKLNGCKQLRLCTGIENELGKKFYETHGWQLRAVAYKKKIAE